ncbi:MAG: aldehyde dehydrogenase family protein [Planctomycetota bacterium]|nr:MAG: aldehyde dehydrogenase family protein [Planctomycetota bacterium]
MAQVLSELGIDAVNPGAATGAFFDTQGEELASENPATGEVLARVRQATREDYERVVAKASEAFLAWRDWPAPRRGEVVRSIGEALRAKKEALGRLVSLECGKILQEGLGEVQEMIDICDFAVGLSRSFGGRTMHSERPAHRMYEQWHPLGPVGIISAFNFPVAVWSWNSMIALVCGDTCIWKPSEITPLCAVAVQKITHEVLRAAGAPEGVSTLVIGGLADVGQPLVADRRIPLISATGSCRMGKEVAPVVAARMGRCLLELGGNNAIIVRPDADLDLATRGILFGAVGTAGQRCTSTRRVLVHPEVAPELTRRLLDAYRQVRIGDPLAEGTLMGPLIHQGAVDQMLAAIEAVEEQGGEVLCGGKRYTEGACAKGYFVEPTLVRAHKDMPILRTETFAPILYLLEVEDLDEAIAIQNDVPQGLSSAIFTNDLRSAERFLAASGSDCGIANVNIGTSGAEIGGAFGGEKETGGGREAGSDAWKAYMRRQTCTINYSTELPLAQGIQFG